LNPHFVENLRTAMCSAIPRTTSPVNRLWQSRSSSSHGGFRHRS
jgi:hypothetical protein